MKSTLPLNVLSPLEKARSPACHLLPRSLLLQAIPCQGLWGPPCSLVKFLGQGSRPLGAEEQRMLQLILLGEGSSGFSHIFISAVPRHSELCTSV